MINVISAITITLGTKILETLSATLLIGAFEEAASFTSFIILLNVVSSPTLVALALIFDSTLIQPAITF